VLSPSVKKHFSVKKPGLFGLQNPGTMKNSIWMGCKIQPSKGIRFLTCLKNIYIYIDNIV
jgi:hypothetical protein